MRLRNTFHCKLWQLHSSYRKLQHLQKYRYFSTTSSIMGGKLFNSGPEPLSTPRMALKVYTHVHEYARSLLLKHYEHVGTPIEAPGKTTYGDVDFLIANPISVLPEPKVESLAKILGATRWQDGNPEMSFALPYSILPEPEVLIPDLKSGKSNGDFAQVDIITCPTAAEFSWLIFFQAHGDLWGMLGSILRPLGFTVNTNGLNLRIQSIEKLHRKKALILLSSDPDQILEFLGMEKERFWRQFGSEEEMFEYVTTCRFFYTYNEKQRTLAVSDKQRVKTRPIFKRWINEFLPKNRKKGEIKVKIPKSRNEWLKEALESFGDVPKAAYYARLKEYELLEQKRKIMDVIQEAVPPAVETDDDDGKLTVIRANQRGATLHGLKTIIFDGNKEHGITLDEGIVGEDGTYDLDKLRSFVQRNWEKVGELEWARIAKVIAEKRRRLAEVIEDAHQSTS